MQLYSYHIHLRVSYRLVLEDGTNEEGIAKLSMDKPKTTRSSKEVLDDLYIQLSREFPDIMDIDIISFTKSEVPM